MSDLVENVSSAVEQGLIQVIKEQFAIHAGFIAGVVFGFLMAYIYHRFIGKKLLITSYENLLAEKNERIKAYGMLINEKLGRINVQESSAKSLFKKLKKFFKIEYNKKVK